MEKRLRELKQQFEHVLAEWVSEEELRNEWRAHAYDDAPEPSHPTPKRPLVFRGSADTGSVIEIWRRPDGACDVELDGSVVELLESPCDLPGETALATFTFDGVVFREMFSVSKPALGALAGFASERERQPPWRYAPELMADWLIDRSFGLTRRGHRALAAGRLAAPGLSP
jgi:hypothetical protein